MSVVVLPTPANWIVLKAGMLSELPRAFAALIVPVKKSSGPGLVGSKNSPVAGSITFVGTSRMPAPVLQPRMNADM